MMRKGIILLLGLSALLAASSPGLDTVLERISGESQSQQLQSLAQFSEKIYGSDPALALETNAYCRILAARSGNKALIGDSFYQSGYICFRLSMTDSSEYYLLKSLDIRREIGDSSGFAVSLNRLGNVYWGMNEQMKAFHNFTRARDIHHRLGDVREEGRALNNLGNCYRQWGNYDKALEYFLEASQLYDDCGYDEGAAWLNFSITLLYNRLGYYNKSLQYVKKSLQTYLSLTNQHRDSSGIMICYGQMGEIYSRLGDYQNALIYHKKALAMRIRRGISGSIADGYTGIGRVYYELGEYDLALENLQEAITVRNKLRAKIGISTPLRYIGLIYLSRGDTAKALEYLEKGLSFARDYSQLPNEAGILKVLASISADRHEYRRAFDLNQAFQMVQDSLSNIEVQKSVARLRADYDLQESEKENLRLSQENRNKELQLQKSRGRSRSLIMVILIIFLLVLIVLYYYRKSRRDNVLLREMNHEISAAHQSLTEEVTERKRIEKEREDLIIELQESLNNVKTLKGLIPICSNCKKVRNDDGYYEQLEKYLSEHTEAEFSHGLCADCYATLYPELKQPPEDGSDVD